MEKVTKPIYNTALARIEELLPLVNDETSPLNRYAVELKIMSDIVIEYETEHFPVKNPSLAEVVKMRLEEENLSQRAFAAKIGVSSSRVSEYLTGKSEPTLRVARNICNLLHIEPAIVLGV
jgi:HTH-type transcriptional regulator/antitoxin HigA